MMKFNLILIILLLPLVTAEVYHLNLLAVKDNGGGNYTGSKADLYLELKPGTGRVFLDTYPLTKMDTQISTRFAKEIACNHYNLNCDNYDFIYTIRSGSNIIGGPSAGAAIAALTTIAVKKLPYDQNIAITGTINSGGIIGSVGGVQEKISAAAQAGIKKVIVPYGNGFQNQISFFKNPFENITSNQTLNQSNNFNLEILELISLDDVIFQYTGKHLNSKLSNLSTNDNYDKIMLELKDKLCSRTQQLEQLNLTLTPEEKNISKNRLEKINLAMETNNYYSAASYCFSENIYLRNLYYDRNSFSCTKLKEEISEQNNQLLILINNKEIKTISDLQTKIVVKERINDVTEILKNVNCSGDNYNYLLAYSKERLYSAVTWTKFFSMEGKVFQFNEENLKDSCYLKIQEGEERIQYSQLYINPLQISYLDDKLNLAKNARDKKDYELCLVKASEVKAEANSIISTLGLTEENLEYFYEAKKNAVENVINFNSNEKIFPILGYSYYNYAQSLYEESVYSGLLYLEYALEMSDLTIYFPEEKSFYNSIYGFLMKVEIILVIQGIILGILLTLFLINVKKMFKK
jgi:uncharacterized protein